MRKSYIKEITQWQTQGRITWHQAPYAKTGAIPPTRPRSNDV